MSSDIHILPANDNSMEENVVEENVKDHDSADEFQDFIEKHPMSSKETKVKRNFIENILVKPKVDHIKEVEEASDTGLPLINFSSMQKANATVKEIEVIHNDLDLRELQKSFVRRKNVKFQQLRTEEHSDESDRSDSSSSDNDDDSIVIPQGLLCDIFKTNYH